MLRRKAEVRRERRRRRLVAGPEAEFGARGLAGELGRLGDKGLFGFE